MHRSLPFSRWSKRSQRRTSKPGHKALGPSIRHRRLGCEELEDRRLLSVAADVTRPTSKVDPLPAYENSTVFRVSWSGSDGRKGSGLASYTIYVKDNSGNYAAWLSNVTQTSALFTGQGGHKYRFYSMATDNAGNVQKKPSKARTTTVDVAPPTSSVLVLPAVQRSAKFKVKWSGSDASGGSGVATYTVYVSDNGGAFVPFVTASKKKSATFRGQPDHTYAFFSVATDKAGNVQPLPAGAQAITETVHDVPPTLPVDADPATNAVNEGAGAGTTVGIAARSMDSGGPISYVLSTNPGGLFAIDPGTGVVSVAPGQTIPSVTEASSYTIGVEATENGASSPETSFTITVAVEQRAIERLAMNPDAVVVNQPVTVTATVQVGADPDLQYQDVHLWQLNGEGLPDIDFGRMYDDATHGDALSGDGTFTMQFEVNASAIATTRYMASASYSTAPTIGYSNVATLDAVVLPTNEEVQQALDENASYGQSFDTLAQTVGADAARQQLLASLQSDPAVASAVLADDGTSINITYTSGLGSVILTGPPGTRGSSDYEDTTGSSMGTALAFPGLFAGPLIAQFVSENTLVQFVTFMDSNYTLDRVANLGGNAVILFVTHGGVWGSDVILATGEQASTILGIPTSHLVDWALHRVELMQIHGANFWAFAPSFITAHCSNFPNSIVFASACESLRNHTMANAFLSKGAKAYIGCTGTVGGDFIDILTTMFFVRMAGIDVPPSDPEYGVGDTVREAFHKWTLDERTDPDYRGVLRWVGDGNVKLPTDPIKNSNSEAGDLDNPNTGAVLAAVVSDFAYPGTWGIYWESASQTATYDLSAFAPQTIGVHFGDPQDGYGDQCASYFDKVSIKRVTWPPGSMGAASLPSASAFQPAACDAVAAMAGAGKHKETLDPSMLDRIACAVAVQWKRDFSDDLSALL